MDDAATIEMIKRISDANGISGFEDEVLDEIRNSASGLGEFSEDSLRNLYLQRRGRDGLPVLQLDAHTDEVGFMVKAIRPNGMIDFIPIGGWVATNVPAHRVRIRNSEGVYIPGVVASKPPHFMSEAEKKAPLEMSSLVIDVGALSAEEVARDFKIPIASPVVPDTRCEYLSERGLLFGKAFDCRLGCAAIVSTLRKLEGADLGVKITAGFASQEEVGVRGATVTANRIKPDIALVFEGCPADDTVVDSYAVQTAIRKGPMLRHIDSRMITNPRYQRFALDIASECGIPVQEAVRSAGATNGAAIHLSNNGVPVIVVGIPVRYAHTHYGISAYSDYVHAVKIACEVITRLDRGIISGF